mgnify:CR=1 FL=1
MSGKDEYDDEDEEEKDANEDFLNMIKGLGDPSKLFRNFDPAKLFNSKEFQKMFDMDKEFHKKLLWLWKQDKIETDSYLHKKGKIDSKLLVENIYPYTEAELDELFDFGDKSKGKKKKRK